MPLGWGRTHVHIPTCEQKQFQDARYAPATGGLKLIVLLKNCVYRLF